jgi:hypothetical protein
MKSRSFSCKPVIPAKAGIQIFFAKEPGCLPGEGMTAKLPTPQFFNEDPRSELRGIKAEPAFALASYGAPSCAAA